MRPSSLALAFSIAAPAIAAIHVQPSQTTFNPTSHQTIAYSITVTEPGVLTAQILDRDTYPTKTLAHSTHVTPGTISLMWDGTDDQGRTVPDEAWNVRVELQTSRGVELYFPASRPAAMTGIEPDFYDVRTGILGYKLPVASRIHVQAGIRDTHGSDPTAGAVMKTVVNRAPRPAGAVVEQWTGMDESGTIYVPELKNFVVAIAATPLPENSVITYGNRERDFLGSVLQREGTPAVTTMPAAHHHGLTTLDDVSPALELHPKNAAWRGEGKKWVTSSSRLELTATPAGKTAARFASQPARLVVYVDDRRVVDKAVGSSRSLSVELPQNGAEHVVAVNWVSDYGPVAASAFRVQRSR